MALDSVAAARDLGAKGEQRGFGGSSAGSVEHLLRNDEGREEKLIDRDAGENEMDGGEGELDVGGDDLHFGVGVHLHEDVLRVSRFNRSKKTNLHRFERLLERGFVGFRRGSRERAEGSLALRFRTNKPSEPSAEY